MHMKPLSADLESFFIYIFSDIEREGERERLVVSDSQGSHLLLLTQWARERERENRGKGYAWEAEAEAEADSIRVRAFYVMEWNRITLGAFSGALIGV